MTSVVGLTLILSPSLIINGKLALFVDDTNQQKFQFSRDSPLNMHNMIVPTILTRGSDNFTKCVMNRRF